MPSLTKLMLSSILITLIVLGLSSPVGAQPPPPTLYVEAPSTVGVSTEFDIIISIRDIPAGWGVVDFSIFVQWDPNDLEIIECESLNDDRTGWSGGCGFDSSIPGLAAGGSDGPRWTEDAEWLRFRFHCLREGPAILTVFTEPPLVNLDEATTHTIALEDVSGGRVDVEAEPVTVTVNQVGPVGGVVTPVNKLEILTPYIALAGLIAAISAVYVMRRRKV
ncbi:MAG: hypothetical protein WBF08_03235 [Candidatus Bathyarchaeia archaeon]